MARLGESTQSRDERAATNEQNQANRSNVRPGALPETDRPHAAVSVELRAESPIYRAK